MAVRIKICGITNEEDGLAASHLGADAIGFVFAASPRQVSAERAREIIATLPPLVQRVGVFVDEDPEKVASIAEFCRLDVLQLHGSESVAYCRRFERRVIKAVRVGSGADLDDISQYSNAVDALLLDTYVANQHGGTGKTFDWNLAVEAKQYGRIVLAGGLNPDNVEEAVRMVRPYAVDASSGLEQKPGIKDHGKLAQFIERATEAARKDKEQL
jgi:phosphoribosylanthranilate isomerase